MQRPDTPVSLADLSAVGIRLRPDEAAALVRDLALQVSRGQVSGVPSAHVIRLSAGGAISIEGPVAAGGRSVVRAAQLLDALLPTALSGGNERIPGGLKLLLARALGTLDLPPFASLDEFAGALARFAASDASATVRNLVDRWTQSVTSSPEVPNVAADQALPVQSARIERFASPDPRADVGTAPSSTLSISDIRRARRATGLTLTQVSERSRIPLALLRQLEWGYLLNWPSGRQGRIQLMRYARAAGLDEQVVVATAAPLLVQGLALRPLFTGAPARAAAAIEAPGAVPVRSPRVGNLQVAADAATQNAAPESAPKRPAGALAPFGMPGRQPDAPARGRRSALGLLAVPALLVLGLLPAWWMYSSEADRHPERAPVTPTSRVADQLPPREAPARQSEVVATGGRDEQANTPPRASERDEQVTMPLAPEPAAGRGAPSPAVSSPAAAGAVDRTLPRVDAAPAAAFSPTPAAVGTAMFHSSEEGDSGAAPVLRVTRIVDETANFSHVRPSPDGRRLAFDSDRDGERGVYVANADGGNVRRVSPRGFAAVPSWSPDGRSLAFLRADPERPGQVWHIWTLDLATGVLRQITSHEQGHPSGASWFADGRRLAYGVGERLVIRDLEGGGARTFTSPRKGRVIRAPVVSPDGNRVVFQVSRDGTWLLDLADGSMRRVLEDPTADEYAWSADGTQLAYHSERIGGWSVWVMAPR